MSGFWGKEDWVIGMQLPCASPTHLEAHLLFCLPTTTKTKTTIINSQWTANFLKYMFIVSITDVSRFSPFARPPSPCPPELQILQQNVDCLLCSRVSLVSFSAECGPLHITFKYLLIDWFEKLEDKNSNFLLEKPGWYYPTQVIKVNIISYVMMISCIIWCVAIRRTFDLPSSQNS